LHITQHGLSSRTVRLETVGSLKRALRILASRSSAALFDRTSAPPRAALFDRRLQQLKRRDLIVVDELGYIPFSKLGAEHLFGFFSQCYEQASLVVTTNLPFADWPQTFGGDERLTGALLDRLTHRVHIVEITGDSYRLQSSMKSKADKEPKG
jgi:hypothetical protein